MDDIELRLRCTESCLDFDCSSSSEEDEKHETDQEEEEVESERNLEEEVGSCSEAESEMSFKGWLDQTKQRKFEFNHLHDMVDSDPMKGFGEDENELALKPRKRIKFWIDSIDSMDEISEFSFIENEKPVVQAKDNFKEKTNIKFELGSVEDENKLALKPRKIIKSWIDSIDSIKELPGFSFIENEPPVVQVKDNSKEKTNIKFELVK